MSETREPQHHGPAASGAGDSRGASDGRAAKAIALLNYAQVLQEYLEEQLPGIWSDPGADKPDQSLAGHLVALDALAAVTSLLTAFGAGRQVDAVEFETVLTEAKAAFAESGMVGGNWLAPTNSQPDGGTASPEGFGWSLPRWCVEKLCRGMEELFPDVAESRGREPLG